MCSSQPKDVLQFCPKCGNDRFIYRIDQSFYCKKCDFQLYINSAAAVAAIIVNEENEILLTRRAIEPNKGMLDLPGGFVDPMESAESALIREVKEELNLDIDQFIYLMSSPNEYVFAGFSVFTTDLAYICQVKSFENILAKDDINAFEFYPIKEIPFHQIGGESIVRILEYFIKDKLSITNL